MDFVCSTLSVLTGVCTPDQILLTPAGHELTDETLGSLDVVYMFSKTLTFPQLSVKRDTTQLESASEGPGEYSQLVAQAQALKNELNTYHRYLVDTEHHYHLLEKGLEVLNKYYQRCQVEWLTSTERLQPLLNAFSEAHKAEIDAIHSVLQALVQLQSQLLPSESPRVLVESDSLERNHRELKDNLARVCEQFATPAGQTVPEFFFEETRIPSPSHPPQLSATAKELDRLIHDCSLYPWLSETEIEEFEQLLARADADIRSLKVDTVKSTRESVLAKFKSSVQTMQQAASKMKSEANTRAQLFFSQLRAAFDSSSDSKTMIESADYDTTFYSLDDLLGLYVFPRLKYFFMNPSYHHSDNKEEVASLKRANLALQKECRQLAETVKKHAELLIQSETILAESKATIHAMNLELEEATDRIEVQKFRLQELADVQPQVEQLQAELEEWREVGHWCQASSAYSLKRRFEELNKDLDSMVRVSDFEETRLALFFPSDSGDYFAFSRTRECVQLDIDRLGYEPAQPYILGRITHLRPGYEACLLASVEVVSPI